MRKLLIVSSIVWLAATSLTVQAADQAVVDRYGKTCSVCHASGVANAPTTGNAEQWAPRLEKGLDALVDSVNKGLNAMPPKGMCYDCSADDYKALIGYMATAK
jgi:cytochrome c5